MKTIIFLAITTLFLTGCSKSDEDTPFQVQYFFYDGYNSKDSIHHYYIDLNNLLKKKRDDLYLEWSKPSIQPSPEILDMGYGETNAFEYFDPKVVLDTDNHIFTLWRARNEYDIKANYYYCIGLYSISGDYIKNQKVDFIKYQNTNYLPQDNTIKFVETNDKNILIINNGYTIIDKDINIIETYSEKKIPFYGNIKFISNRCYATYNNNLMSFFNLTTKEIINTDITKFINSKYSNEIYPPKYTISNIKIESDNIEIALKITLYNGRIENIIAKVDSNTGELKN